VYNPLNMSNKTVLVTGASSGIGRQTAVELAALGARLVLVGRDEVNLAATLALLPDAKHVLAPFDLNQPDKLSGWLREMTASIGLLHGLAHCAGIHLVKPLKFMEPKDYQLIFESNIGVAFNLSKAFCQKRIASKPASIVFISSAAAIKGQAAIAAYAASKGALISLTRSLAIELAQDGIRVNCVVPGVVQTAMTEKLFDKMTEQQIQTMTKMHPLGLGKAEDVAHAIAYLLSDASRWMTGTSLVIDGGYSAH